MRSTVYALAAAAVSLFPGGAQAHMIMKTPTPFGGSSLDNSPLTGTTFPCQLGRDAAAFFSRTTTKPTVMSVGEKQTLSFKGSAVHGGGSCQLAVTSDKMPDKASKWQVILSLEGGCPSKDGSGPSEYEFSIPEQVQPGEYVFAWTWISKLAGQPEYYMNCAPITVTGGGKKLKKRDTSSAALPDLFVANLAGINTCKTTPGTDVLYPQPGPYVAKLGSKNNFAEITVKSGACTASGDGSDAPGSGSGGGGGGDNGSPSNGGGGSPNNGGSGGPSNGGGSDNGSPSNGGGGGGAGSAPAPTPPAVQPTPTTLVSSSTGTAPAAAPTGGAGLSGACSEEGVFNCVAGTSYQQCASGQWTALQAMPSGTKCKLGQSATLWNRGEPRPRLLRRML